MLGIIKSELLKTRRPVPVTSVLIAPLVTLMLGYLLSGNFVQLSAYNWWCVAVLPFVVSSCSAGTVIREKKTGMQNIAFLPVRAEKIWFGKTVSTVIQVFAADMLLWLLTTAVGFLTKVTVSPLDGLAGCLLLTLTNIWQVPLVMALAYFTGYVPAVSLSLAANIILTTVGAETKWFLFIPYAIPTRIVYPFFKMHANGLPLESGSPFLSYGDVLPALLCGLLYALVVFTVSSKLLAKGAVSNG